MDIKVRRRCDVATIEVEEQNASILLKLILNYFQIIIVLTTFQINIPAVFNETVDVVASPATSVIYSFECFFYELSQQVGVNRIYLQFIGSTLLPIFCLAIFYFSG